MQCQRPHQYHQSTTIAKRHTTSAETARQQSLGQTSDLTADCEYSRALVVNECKWLLGALNLPPNEGVRKRTGFESIPQKYQEDKDWCDKQQNMVSNKTW